jgi:nitrous oxidase accessory protein NosD
VAALLASGPCAAEDWPCPADPITGEGWPTLDVFDFGAVGDGTVDDAPAIQLTIEYAHGMGGATVHLPAGTYRLDGPVRPRSNVILQGEGDATVLQVSGDTNGLVLRGNDASDVVHTVAIRDLQVRGPELPDTLSTLIAMEAFVENVRVERCMLVNAGYDAWHALRDCARICVLDNVVNGAGDDGLNPGGSSIGVGTHDVLIRGNAVSGVTQDGIHVSVDSYDVVVVENTVVDCDRGVALLSRNADIIANTISGCSRGVLISRGYSHRIEENTITDCLYGIRTFALPIPDVRVIDNVIEVEQIGIDIDGARTQIRGNTVTAGDRGIVVEGWRSIVDANAVRDTGSAGITVYGGAVHGDVEVTGNDVRNAGSYGILIDARCTLATRNTVRDATGYSIRDFRQYSRKVLNDTDGPVDGLRGDVDCSESIDVADLVVMLMEWGACAGEIEDCAADVDGDGVVGTADLVELLANMMN